MKLTIVSDIKRGKDSVIVYGLKLARYLEWEVDIVHMVDPRSVHGVASTYSDSQTITPGRKMSPEEIVAREIRENQAALDDLISGEGSRLDYPLKINVVVEEGAIEGKMRRIKNDEEQGLVLMNSDLDHNVISSQSELFDIIKSIPAPYLLVSPNQEFTPFNQMILPAAFITKDLNQYPKVSHVLKHFKSHIEAVDVVKDLDANNNMQNRESWLRNARDVFPASTIDARGLQGKEYNQTLVDHVKKSKPDLVMLFKKEQSIFDRLFKKELMKQLMEETDVPLLFYNSQ
ncbi:hypothetical protein [Salinivirga cyanobacteriivorans]